MSLTSLCPRLGYCRVINVWHACQLHACHMPSKATQNPTNQESTGEVTRQVKGQFTTQTEIVLAHVGETSIEHKSLTLNPKP